MLEETHSAMGRIGHVVLYLVSWHSYIAGNIIAPLNNALKVITVTMHIMILATVHTVSTHQTIKQLSSFI